MSRYHYHRRNGRSPQEAMVETFRTVGIAVVTTTIAIAIGFSVLAASGFRVNRDLGMITTATLVSALAATLFFLPPLLLLLDRGGKRRRH
ncbi:MAG: MMPL family transporter, partial [Rhodobiaceae bacterium]|nr:MMPL family transporter [Rhodobiaceae bacterium]